MEYIALFLDEDRLFFEIARIYPLVTNARAQLDSNCKKLVAMHIRGLQPSYLFYLNTKWMVGNTLD